MNNELSQSYTETFQRVYDNYADDIFRFAMVKTRNREQALDTTQETFTRFWEYLSDGDDIENYRAFLYRVANNLIIDGYRKKKSDQLENYDVLGSHEHLETNPEQQLSDKIDGELALKLFDQLPELTSEILVLRFMHDMSISEIADIVDRDNNTVSVYIHRGLKRLKELMEKQDSNIK